MTLRQKLQLYRRYFECIYQILIDADEEAHLDEGRQSKTLFPNIYRTLKHGAYFIEDWYGELENMIESIEEVAVNF